MGWHGMAWYGMRGVAWDRMAWYSCMQCHVLYCTLYTLYTHTYPQPALLYSIQSYRCAMERKKTPSQIKRNTIIFVCSFTKLSKTCILVKHSLDAALKAFRIPRLPFLWTYRHLVGIPI